MLSNYDLTGKNSLVTGACGLLGMEHAVALLECNSNLILTDLCHKKLEEARETLSEQFRSASIEIAEMDVSNPNSVNSVSEWLNSSGSTVNVLVNNAAIDPKVNGSGSLVESCRLEHFALGEWEAQLSVGLTGAFLCSQTFGKKMAESGCGGVILNIASDLSVIAPDQRLYRDPCLAEDMQPVKPITYSVIKTGLIGLTKYLASYWAAAGVRSNALSPGGVYTNQSQDFVDKLVDLVPMGRMAKVDEYRSAVQFLCSDASKYMTGQNLVIDGGRSVI